MIILFILIGQIFLISSSYLVSMFSTTAGLLGFHHSCIYPFLFAAIIPIKTYSNAEADKAIILKENKNKSGIYMWENSKNDKKYIGSAVDISKRLSNDYSTTYMEDALKKGNSHIYCALLKNGYSNFSITILEYCSPEQCIQREDYYLCSLPHEYNILPKAGSPLGRNHTKETKIIMSDAKKGEKNPMYNKPKPEGAAKPSQSIEVTDITNNTTISYDSMSEAARALNIKHSTITNYILRNQKKPYKGIYTFKKV